LSSLALLQISDKILKMRKTLRNATERPRSPTLTVVVAKDGIGGDDAVNQFDLCSKSI